MGVKENETAKWQTSAKFTAQIAWPVFLTYLFLQCLTPRTCKSEIPRPWWLDIDRLGTERWSHYPACYLMVTNDRFWADNTFVHALSANTATRLTTLRVKTLNKPSSVPAISSTAESQDDQNQNWKLLHSNYCFHGKKEQSKKLWGLPTDCYVLKKRYLSL